MDSHSINVNDDTASLHHPIADKRHPSNYDEYPASHTRPKHDDYLDAHIIL